MNLVLESSIASTLALFSAFLLLGGGRRTPALYFLASLTGAIALMIALNIPDHPPRARSGVNLVLELLVGPLLYLYITHVLAFSARPRLWILVHLAPAIGGVVLWKAGALASMGFYVTAVTTLYLAAAWYSFLTGYGAVARTYLPRILAGLLTLFLLLAMLRLLIATSAVSSPAFEQTPLYTALLGILLLIVWGLLITAMRYPSLLTDPERYIPYAQSGADPADLRRLEARLRRLMETERLYTDPDVSVSRVAQRLAVPPRHLSQLINSRFEETFPAFINALRVQAAAQALRSEPDKPIKAVMYESGFRSKSVFNREFQRTWALTPTEYRGRFAAGRGSDKAN